MIDTRANGPSEEQIEKAARAFFREYHGEDIWPELWDDGELDTRSRALAATRVALTAAGVASQPVIDEDALAEVIEAEIEKLRHETRLYPDIYKAEVARAVAEWLKGQGGEGRESTDAN